MTKKEFLKKSDVNILGYQITDTVDSKGRTSVDVLLKVGKSKKKMKKELNALSQEELAKKLKITFCEYEILLTKKELNHLLSEINEFEENGPAYLKEE
jgi:hypothetical protein